ncbi:lytic transglycosylase domain-containing protein [Paraburkholderia humisilvae]|uniref:lytic transglycosylase domain-containing protein n=1 Tax=Paraburkholderia humisilvae TaxID=627669 RepID=UPI00158226E8|nr:lytic transglycosylase domain-containing protein [Paraburkholderia humisilvae]
MLITFPATAQAVEGVSRYVIALSRECAEDVHPLTIAYLVSVESRNNPLAIHVNGDHRLPRQPATMREAREAIQWLDKNGLNYDVGYGQVNSGNFRRLGLSGVQLLDGCTNLRAVAQILDDCYTRAVQVVGEGQAALRRAISCYNTGSQRRGFVNGYVARVVAVARLKVPALLVAPNSSNAHIASDESEDSLDLRAETSLNSTHARQLSESSRASPPPIGAGEPGATGRVGTGDFSQSEEGAYMSSRDPE